MVASTSSRRDHAEAGLDRSESSVPKSDLQDLRTKFAIANAGTDLHFCADSCNRADDLAAIIRRDTVTAAQRRVGSEHAENFFNVAETVSCVFK